MGQLTEGLLSLSGWPAPWPSGSPGPWPATRPATGSAAAGGHACSAPPSGAGSARSACTRWAAAHVLLGYAAGAGWRQVHHLTGQVGLLLAGAVLVALAVAWLVHRPARGYEDEPVQPVAAGRRPD